MKKQALLAAMASALLVSYPLGAKTNEMVRSLSWETAGVAGNMKVNDTVSVHDFIQFALNELTYQHGSKEMRDELVQQWVGADRLDFEEQITKGQIAKILVHALQIEEQEKSAADYMHSAQIYQLLKVYSQEDETVTAKEMESIINNAKEIASKEVNNKGVKEISVEGFMKNPGDFGYQISPDGEYISYSSEWKNRMNVFVKKMHKEDEPIRVTSSTDRDVASSFWKDNHILYLKDNGGDENFHIYASRFNGQEERDLTPYPGAKVQLISNLSGVENEILIGLNKDDPTVFDVYRLNVKTGDLDHVAKNPGNITDWLADHDGKIRIAIETDGVDSTILYRETEEDDFKPFVQTEESDVISPIAFSKDNQSIYALSNKGRDKMEVVVFDLDANEKVLYSHPQADVTNTLYNKKKDALAASMYVTDKSHYEFFDKELERIFHKVKDELQVDESELTLKDYNEDMNKFIVLVSSDKDYGTYYYYDSTTDELTKLTELSSWLDQDQLADMHPISYTSRDGLTIHGYLTVPKNKKVEQLPLIVNPHGGPWARDVWGFNPEVQLLANRGYAVLQVNFRSSTGYGKAFTDAGNKEWGLKIQNDITDGVQWAIDQGIADPDRVGIYGASFGGYATLAGITFTPDLYAAAVDYVGVSNIFTLLETMPPYWETIRNDLYKRVGHPVNDKELLESVSPVFHVDKIKTPLFVAQGANDPRVNQAESDQIVEALQKRGIDVEYMLKENEGHGFRNEENRIEFYHAMIEFFDKHLK
ncbi:S9 family peptidase [Sporosarcina sp. P37]|uniref:S9 family peptidase n=1 Tax=unclassified Sporosarcina TaxID=2647733 RepID=UPI000A17D334|nr:MULTISPECIES: S9 family peptidase [unclassified Sporosarcina]ARK23490.1 S9 family peptidase [Sporosarcina sp. P37]